MQKKLLNIFGGSLHPGGEQLTKKIIHGCAVSSGRVLDIGCGTGISCALMAERGFDAYGIDSDPDHVQASRRTACDAQIIQGDINLLPFEDDFFDLILCECVLSTAGDKETPLSEALRVLKAGGRLAWSDICSKNDSDSWSVSGWSRFFGSAGFSDVSIFSADEEWRAFVSKIIWNGEDLGEFADCLCLGIPAKEMSYCFGFAQKPS